ncbi:electron transfer flavoprotein subunit alpha/FixB family protein [Thermodesulfobacteriota bacterium]
MSSGQGVWIFIEQNNEDIEDVSFEIINKGHEIATEFGEETNAVIVGPQHSDTIKQLSGSGADKIYFIDHPELLDNSVESCAEALFELFEENRPRLVLFGASLFGNDLACRLASRSKAALITNCIQIALNEKKEPLYTKLTHGARVSGTFICPSSGLHLATVVSGVFEKKKPNFSKTADTVLVKPQLRSRKNRIKRIGMTKADPEKIGLDEADIIVSGGRGMDSTAQFEKLKALSKILGGAVGASLGAVDDGLAPRKSLVGQTGTTVTPKLYMACGISGSIYHVLGMKDSKAIVAINTDRHADIFKYSDMGIVGDAVEIIDAIHDRLSAVLKEKHNERTTS